VELRRQVLILSNRKQILDFFKDSLKDITSLKMFDEKEKIFDENKIKFIFKECDYICSTKKCLKHFIFLLSNCKIPFAIARPILLRKNYDFVRGLILSIYEKYSLSPLQEEILNKIKSYRYPPGVIFHPSNIIFKILKIQRKIIECTSEKMTLSSCADQVNLSSSWLSFKFKEISGISLERFLLKIRFCYSLWQILSTNKLIKTIAADLGYEVPIPKEFKGWVLILLFFCICYF
jgi:AraC-like DNA-binding protein